MTIDNLIHMYLLFKRDVWEEFLDFRNNLRDSYESAQILKNCMSKNSFLVQLQAVSLQFY